MRCSGTASFLARKASNYASWLAKTAGSKRFRYYEVVRYLTMNCLSNLRYCFLTCMSSIHAFHAMPFPLFIDVGIETSQRAQYHPPHCNCSLSAECAIQCKMRCNLVLKKEMSCKNNSNPKAPILTRKTRHSQARHTETETQARCRATIERTLSRTFQTTHGLLATLSPQIQLSTQHAFLQ